MPDPTQKPDSAHVTQSHDPQGKPVTVVRFLGGGEVEVVRGVLTDVYTPLHDGGMTQTSEFETVTLSRAALIELMTTAATIGKDSPDAKTRGDLTAALSAYGIDMHKGASLARMIERAEENAQATAHERVANECPDWCTVDHVKTHVLVHRADSPGGVIPSFVTVPGTR